VKHRRSVAACDTTAAGRANQRKRNERSAVPECDVSQATIMVRQAIASFTVTANSEIIPLSGSGSLKKRCGDCQSCDAQQRALKTLDLSAEFRAVHCNRITARYALVTVEAKFALAAEPLIRRRRGFWIHARSKRRTIATHPPHHCDRMIDERRPDERLIKEDAWSASDARCLHCAIGARRAPEGRVAAQLRWPTPGRKPIAMAEGGQS